MTCSESLEHLLGADLGELSGAGASPVASHMRTCRRCRAVAARLGAETDALASALDAGHSPLHLRVRRRRSYQRALLATGLAAAIATVVLWPPASTDQRGSPAPPARLAATVVVPPASAKVVRPVRTSLPATPRRAYPKPQTLTATRIEPTRLVVNGVSPPQALVVVEPQAGRRAAILRTADPSVTVVWLY